MTTSIGYRWKCSNAWSRVVLIARKLLENRKSSFKRTLQISFFSPITCLYKKQPAPPNLPEGEWFGGHAHSSPLWGDKRGARLKNCWWL